MALLFALQNASSHTLRAYWTHFHDYTQRPSNSRALDFFSQTASIEWQIKKFLVAKMEVKDPRCTFLTNQEVLSVLQQATPSSKSKHMLKHNTILYETVKYLKSTAAASQNEADVKKLMTDLQKLFKLTPAEILQIVNLRPTSNVELAMIIEECDERFTEEQLLEMLELVLLNLPENDGNDPAGVDNAEEAEARH